MHITCTYMQLYRTASAGSGSTPPSHALSLAAALSTMSKPATKVALGRGIPTLPERLVERMLACEYIDLADLPWQEPVCLKKYLVPVLLIQSIKTARSHRRLIPDITTWVQCFSIYTSVLATQNAEYVLELMTYTRDIICASKQFKWPAWIVYDTNYRQHMAQSIQRNF